MSLINELVEIFEKIYPFVPKRLSIFPWQVANPPVKSAPITDRPSLRACLVGTKPRSSRISYLVVTNLDGGNSVRLYDLRDRCMKPEGPVKREWIDFIISIGHQIDLPVPQPSVDEIDPWIDHGKLKVGSVKKRIVNGLGKIGSVRGSCCVNPDPS